MTDGDPRPECTHLHDLLHDETMDQEDLMERLKALSGITDCIVDGLAATAADENWCDFELYLWPASSHPSRDLTPVLLDVLRRRDEMAPNEGIVDLLIDVADPAAADALRDMLWWNPEWDEGHWIAIKALYALGNLPGTEADIRGAAETGPDDVRETAERILAYMATERLANKATEGPALWNGQ